MASPKFDKLPWQTQLALLGGGLLVGGFAYAWMRYGSVSKASEAVASGAVKAAVGVVSGVAKAADAVLTPDDIERGFLEWPLPDEMIGDPVVVRWIIDVHGYWTAAKWTDMHTLAKAWALDAGTGWPPAIGAPFYTLQKD